MNFKEVRRGQGDVSVADGARGRVRGAGREGRGADGRGRRAVLGARTPRRRRPRPAVHSDVLLSCHTYSVDSRPRRQVIVTCDRRRRTAIPVGMIRIIDSCAGELIFPFLFVVAR